MKANPPLPAGARSIIGWFVASFLFLSLPPPVSGLGTDKYFTKAGESVDLADHYIQSGRPEKAISIYKNVLQYFPGVPELHMELARIYESINKLKQALKHSRMAHKLAPMENEFAYEYGRLCLITGDPKDAVRTFQRILERDPSYPGAEERLLEACIKGKRWEAALPILRKRLAENPGDLKAREELADCHLGLKEWEKAIKEYRGILSSEPGKSRAVTRLALAYRGDGRPNEAYTLLDSYLEEHPGDKKAKRALRDLNLWMRRGGRAQAPATISTTNPAIERRRGLTTMFKPRAANEQVSYDFYWQRTRNKKTGDTSKTIFHDTEFSTFLNEKLQLNMDCNYSGTPTVVVH